MAVILAITGIVSITFMSCNNAQSDPSDNITEIAQNKEIIEGNSKESAIEDNQEKTDYNNPINQIIIDNALKAEKKNNSNSRTQNGLWWYDDAKVGDNMKLDVDENGTTDNVQLQNGYFIVASNTRQHAINLTTRNSNKLNYIKLVRKRV